MLHAFDFKYRLEVIECVSGHHDDSRWPADLLKCCAFRLQEIPPSTVLVFCHKCVDVFAVKHKCPSEIVSRAQLRAPTRLLAAKESQSGEAQFYFSDESLSVLKNVVRRSQIEGVLCLGTPRLFEELRQETGDRRLFLLDYDKRFAQFFPAHQFGQYSMLVDHFYDERSSEELHGFFECSSVLLVCDPPFGVFLNPLMRTCSVSTGISFDVKNLEVLGNVLEDYKDYWMSDYRITYESHRLFSNASKTIVRCFTNLKADVFDLSNVKGYKFCEFCEKYVSSTNKHCFMCSSCTSKVYTYKHCDRCMRCVKVSYYHCKKCTRCHLKGRFDHD
ncbi:unnamed protein product [Angiostrongylus costaricensis]|uniref:CTCHY-type domain-containing protein n=1 Tax=Angiostrongylus costaricensis TaxID=334426 RepID=A0A0R3Q181_ANGCS|nr:unnamed protein product [Angiostrongylus costaricensis]